MFGLPPVGLHGVAAAHQAAEVRAKVTTLAKSSMQLFLLARKDGFNLIEVEAARMRNENVAAPLRTDASFFTTPRTHQGEAALFCQAAQPALPRKDVSTE